MSGEIILFYAMAGLLIFSALMTVSRSNPIASAIYLIISLFVMAAFFASLGADFVAAIQVLVYAGAIMVLFLFVIMLLNIDPKLLKGQRISFGEIAVLALTILTFVIFASLISISDSAELPSRSETLSGDLTANISNTTQVGIKLFTTYLWPFELASFLILLAIVASVVIAKKDKAQSIVGRVEKGLVARPVEKKT